MKLLAKIFIDLLTNFQKDFHLRCLAGPKYASGRRIKIVRYVNLYFSLWSVTIWWGYHFKSFLIFCEKYCDFNPIALKSKSPCILLNKKSEIWEQNCVWLFNYFSFERNYDVLKSKSPCILLTKNEKSGSETVCGFWVILVLKGIMTF